MKAMILAAGSGTRLRPLTEGLAKPMLPLASRPLLSYTLRLLSCAGVEEAVINLHHRPESVVATLGHLFAGITLQYSHESTLRGTAGALVTVASFFREPFLVIYGDNLLDVDLGSLMAFHRRHNALATLGLFRAPDPTTVGLVRTDIEGSVTAFWEKPTGKTLAAISDDQSPQANTGIYVLDPKILDFIPRDEPSDFGRDIFPRLLRAGAPIAAVPVRGHVQDTGTFAGYRRAHADLLCGLFPRIWFPEEQGLQERQPGIWVHTTAQVEMDVRLASPCLIGERSQVESGARLGPNVTLGSGVVIEPHADLADTVVWSGARIQSRTWCRHSILADQCDVGAETQLLGAVLRSGERLRKGTRRTGGPADPTLSPVCHRSLRPLGM
jgi:mannose-1-phosphate guanylyltransferase / phosphomannomutase